MLMSETMQPPIEATKPKDTEDIKQDEINQKLKAKEDQENSGEVDAEGSASDASLTPEQREKKLQALRKKEPFHGVSSLIKKYFAATSGKQS